MAAYLSAQHVLAYVLSAVVFFALDMVWLTRVARDLYVARIGDLLLDKPRMAAAAAFYLVYVVGIVIFAVAPALRTDNAGTALLYGALFGFFAYATYDMTNYATLKGWPLSLCFIDIAWGTILTGVSAWAGFTMTRLLYPG